MKMLRNQANIINIKFHFAFFYAQLSSIAHRVDPISLIDFEISVSVIYLSLPIKKEKVLYTYFRDTLFSKVLKFHLPDLCNQSLEHLKDFSS